MVVVIILSLGEVPTLGMTSPSNRERKHWEEGIAVSISFL